MTHPARRLGELRLALQHARSAAEDAAQCFKLASSWAQDGRDDQADDFLREAREHLARAREACARAAANLGA